MVCAESSLPLEHFCLSARSIGVARYTWSRYLGFCTHSEGSEMQ